MFRKYISQKYINVISSILMVILCMFLIKLDVEAVSFPGINVSFDAVDESVIVDGIPAGSSDGLVEYQLEGYLNYESERIETFCYAPKVMPYDVADKMAYIFNWSGDKERFLPCTGEYKFTTYVTARYKDAQGKMVEEKGPVTTISIMLNKKDESTNWGPGLPNTTVESYDLNQIKGKDKIIKIEEPDYTWSISGKDVTNVPEKNLSLKITVDPESFQDVGVNDFFGETLAFRMNIEHNGEFGFRAVLEYRMGEPYIGKYANLFYVVGDGNFEYMGGCLVGENGLATFQFTHASDYVIAVTDEEYTGQILNEAPPETIEQIPEESASEESSQSEEESIDKEECVEESALGEEISDETGAGSVDSVKSLTGANPNWIWMLGIVFIIVAILMIVFFKKKK